MMRQLAVGGLLLVAAACGPSVPLGSVEQDNTPINEVPELLHVAAVLENNTMPVKDLFNARNHKFKDAPNPQLLLKGYQTGNDAKTPAANGVNLSVLTYNVAFLKASPFGIKYSWSPEIDARLAVLPAAVMSRGYDVVLLQEIWHAQELKKFQDDAPGMGYRMFAQDRAEYTDGLVILVKESILAPGSTPTLVNTPYETQDEKEFWPGPKVKRGFLHLTMQHVTLGTIHFFDTHMQAFPDQWASRSAQARMLGLAARDASGSDGLAIVTGDMNSGPYYRWNEWRTPNGGTEGDWWSNAVSYPMLLHYGGMADLFAAGTEAQDVFLGNTVVNAWRDSTTIPGSVVGWCGKTPHVVFTATDCNDLYFRQYAGTEYPARLDHVMARDPRNRLVVTGSTLEFTNRREFPGRGSFELSDHFGVGVSMVVAP